MSAQLEATISPTSTSSAAGFPAKTCRAQALARALLAAALDCGVSIDESSVSCAPSGSSSRTSPPSSATGSPLCSGTLPRSGMMRGGIAYLQVPVAPLTDETGSLSWPTPQAHDASGKPGRGCRDRGGHRSDLRVTLEVYGIMGAMNPSWVEQLMGFPEDWTDAGPQGPDKNSTRGSSRARSRKSRTGKAG